MKEIHALSDDQIQSLRGRVLSQDEATTVLDNYETLKKKASSVQRVLGEAFTAMVERLCIASDTIDDLKRQNRRLQERITEVSS